MIYKKSVGTIGGGIGFTFPVALLAYLDLKKGDKVDIKDEIDEKGIYLIIRKSEDQNDSE